MGRTAFLGAEMNLADTVRRLDATPNSKKSSWQRALINARLPLYDVHWTEAIVIDLGRGKGSSGSLRVGLRDGAILPLSANTARQQLKLYDVVYVNVIESTAKDGSKENSRAGNSHAAVGSRRSRCTREHHWQNPRDGRGLLLSTEPA